MSKTLKELKKKSKAELQKGLHEKNITLRDLRFNASGGKSKNVMETRNLKKDIARINTLLKTKTD